MKKPPIEQIAFDAFKRYCENATEENKEAMRRAYYEWQLVKEGKSEPLPQYRGKQ